MDDKSIPNPNASDVGGKKKKSSGRERKIRTHQLAENNIYRKREEVGEMSFSGRWYISDTLERFASGCWITE